MEPILVFGVLTGLVAGSLGYVLYFTAARPILRYRRITSMICRLVSEGDQALVEAGARKRALEAAERLDAVQRELPTWYLLVLTKRGEDPAEAAVGLQKLATVRDPGHAGGHAARIRKLLKRPDGPR